MPNLIGSGAAKNPPAQLQPNLELLRQEYVLVQAWKKTASYIRYHNWFADTLALDHASVNLPSFIGKLRERLRSSETWQNDPLRMVLAPKSQSWRIQGSAWEPVKRGSKSARLRPLAHVSLTDQVLATALMLCLANRIETLQGDPAPQRSPISSQDSRKRVLSYGNRLFCDADNGKLFHRWGAAKLYRAYYEDYRTFLARPIVSAKSSDAPNEKSVYIVHADLRQFYDRVRPALLAETLDRIRTEGDDPAFFSLAKSLLNWGWDSRDEGDVFMYAKQAGLEDFRRVALPQGLVASGFFANAVLLSFDTVLRDAIGTEFIPGFHLVDVCRYVDDLRIVMAAANGKSGPRTAIQSGVEKWINGALDDKAPGLSLSPDKTLVAALGGDNQPLIPQSTKMHRIQAAVSGGFDAVGGDEILRAIQGLISAQKSPDPDDAKGWRFSPIPDVRDETVARFGAGRYRTTFRSIRPMLEDQPTSGVQSGTREEMPSVPQPTFPRTKRELDEDARAFALGLIERWIEDPSNVRLLRIGLDLWPDAEVLRDILSKLRLFTQKGGRRKGPRRVAWYCLAEVLRAGATETGFVAHEESLPSQINLKAYRQKLGKEAARLVTLPARTVPWYVRQQALLLLAAFDPKGAPVTRVGTVPETRHYRELIRFLRGDVEGLRSSSFATLAVLARRSFVNSDRAIELTRQSGLNAARKRQLMLRDPSFLLEIIEDETNSILIEDLPARAREDLSLSFVASGTDHETLADAVLNARPNGPLRSELFLLRFASAFLQQWQKQQPRPEVITPGQVLLKPPKMSTGANAEDLKIIGSRTDATGSIYEVPKWCATKMRWRFQLGFLLRFVLAQHPDFTRPVRPANWKEDEPVYCPAGSHWYQRLYGLYNGQPDFGDDWAPITDWTENFLLALLRWPGCRNPEGFEWVQQGIDAAQSHIAKRAADLEGQRGAATQALILPLRARRPTAANKPRPLRACVVQTAVPVAHNFDPADLALNDSAIRRQHRNHLSAALSTVDRMLILRDTHKPSEGRLDWLILPELAVHPTDVRTHLIPFARAHRAIVLAGLTYEEIVKGQPLINSALWVIPEWSEAYGLQIRTRRQGKLHLAPNEQAFNSGGKDVIRGFRPCQWLIGYPWSAKNDVQPAWLTAAVCYDATDLGLAADLRDKSDIFAIPALNRDTKTFDQMALALHYHMFQLVIVANNGQYGGSNAYWPKKEAYVRQVFHTHGQPQVSISFLEIEDIGAYLDRKQSAIAGKGRPHHDLPATTTTDWKYPPAGLD